MPLTAYSGRRRPVRDAFQGVREDLPVRKKPAAREAHFAATAMGEI
jgi:hypothetical protein